MLDPPVGVVVEPSVSDAAAIRDLLDAQNLVLARARDVPEEVGRLIEELADELLALPVGTPLRVDPYLLVAAHRALMGALRALELEDEAAARREMRLRIEQIRQVYRDLAEGAPLYDDRPPKEVVRWIASVVDVSQPRLAALLGVSPRTLQRWISTSDRAAPEGDDTRRALVVASVVNQLRHALTGPGTVAWFERPHPRLDGERPLDLLEDVDALARLTAVAASTRSHTAA